MIVSKNQGGFMSPLNTLQQQIKLINDDIAKIKEDTTPAKSDLGKALQKIQAAFQKLGHLIVHQEWKTKEERSFKQVQNRLEDLDKHVTQFNLQEQALNKEKEVEVTSNLLLVYIAMENLTSDLKEKNMSTKDKEAAQDLELELRNFRTELAKQLKTLADDS